ncbi:MAG TPA: hypothetical protein VNZ64_17155 [Candidatus Acidoferrum sp.]|jgi:hypothetical protein|nr:hypothetical protein [Candidatus Acidoferrum sp.]
MKRLVRFQVIGTAVVLAGGLTATALVNHAESSALAPLSFFPYLLGAMLGGAHTPSLVGYVVGLVLEWGLIGYLLSGLVCLFIVPGPAQRSTEDKQESTK